jgi:hypothetical protein
MPIGMFALWSADLGNCQQVAIVGNLGSEVARYLEPRQVPMRALVIGIADYKNQTPIPNAGYDARTFGAKLSALGFNQVVVLDKPEDLTANRLWGHIRRFQEGVQPGDVWLFYFAGHGFQVNGANMLAPSDLPRPVRPSDLTSLAIPVDNIIQRLTENKVGFGVVILDACRSNQVLIYEPGTVGKNLGAAGLASMAQQDQIVVGFATKSGEIAVGDENPNQNSVYTKHLNLAIQQPGMEIASILRMVRRNVVLERPTQQPDAVVAASGWFYPNPDAITREVERRTWLQILDPTGDGNALSPQNRSGLAHVYRSVLAYLLEWPVGDFAAAARRFLDEQKGNLPEIGASTLVDPLLKVADANQFVFMDKNFSIADGTIRWFKPSPSAIGTMPTVTSAVEPDYWRIASRNLLAPTNWWTDQISVVQADQATVYKQASVQSPAIAGLVKGDKVLVLASERDALPGWENDGFVKVKVVDGKNEQSVGYISHGLGLSKAPVPISIVSVKLASAAVAELLAGWLPVETVSVQQGADFKTVKVGTPAAYELRKLKELPSVGDRVGDLSKAHIVINLSEAWSDGPVLAGSGLTSQERLLRGLMARRQLIELGAKLENIKMEFESKRTVGLSWNALIGPDVVIYQEGVER